MIVKRTINVNDDVSFVHNSQTAESDQKSTPRFIDSKNMEQYYNDEIDKKDSQYKQKSEEYKWESELKRLEEQLNKVINAMYNDLARQIFKQDMFILPVHGIPNPDQENPMNLFKR